MKCAIAFSGVLLCALLLASAPARAAMMPSHDFGRNDHHGYQDRNDVRRDRNNKRPIFSYLRDDKHDFRDDRRGHDNRRDSRFDRFEFLRRFANLHHGRDHGQHHFREPSDVLSQQPLSMVAQTPLPAALPLFGAGLVALVAVRRRQGCADV